VILEYEEDGHVKDDDASRIKYDELLKQMPPEERQGGQPGADQGRLPSSVELVGWATPPRYDPATHKLYWAKELKFGGGTNNTLNYNLRMLGRYGVLILNAVAPMSKLKDIEAATPEILAMVDLRPASGIPTSIPAPTKWPPAGVAALVAGGVAAKMGLFKGLLVALLAAKKFIVIAAVAVFGFFKKLFTGKKDSSGVVTVPSPTPPNDPPPPPKPARPDA
jgi:uncharacterized membrane-anchored protein